MAKYPEMNWGATNLAEEFTLFRQRMTLCLLDNEVNDPRKIAVKIKIALGNEGLKRLNASNLSDDDQNDPPKIWALFTDQLQTKVNFRIHRLELMRFRQKADESLDGFVTRCCEKAKHCDFEAAERDERMLELVIASTSFEAFQKELLDKPKGFKTDELLAEGRKYEAIAASRRCLQTLEGKSASVDAMQRSRKACSNCGLMHQPRKCPAYNDTCKSCGSKGHWAKFCRKTKRKQQRGKSPRRQRSSSRGSAHSRGKGARPKSRDDSRHIDLMRNSQDQQQHPAGREDNDQTQVDLFYSIHVSDLTMTPVKQYTCR